MNEIVLGQPLPTKSSDPVHSARPGESLDLTFEVPADAPSSSLTVRWSDLVTGECLLEFGRNPLDPRLIELGGNAYRIQLRSSDTLDWTNSVRYRVEVSSAITEGRVQIIANGTVIFK